MNRLDIDLDDNRTAFEPGEVLKGRVVWSLDRVPEAITVSLFWSTGGKAISDEREVQHWSLPATGGRGEQPFDLRLPTEPYSFNGTITSLAWTIRAIASPPEMVASREIVIAPGAALLHLGKVPEDKRTKSWIRFGG